MNNYFNKGKTLFLYPYPCIKYFLIFFLKAEKRLNSEFYDDILKKLNILKINNKNKIEEIEEDSVENYKKNTDFKNKSSKDKFYSKKEEELSILELEKIKLLNDITNIVGISELNSQNTLKFINEQKITNISFIIDPELEFNKKNNLNLRYELVAENEKLIDIKFDPTGSSLIFEYSSFVYYSIIALIICGFGFYYNFIYCLHNYGFIQYYKEIYSSKYIISKLKLE